MTNRRTGLFALLGLVAIFVAIGAVLFLGQLDPCMSGSGGGSCPALADVNGVRYYVSSAWDLVNTDGALTPYADISRTNSSMSFLSMTTYALAGVEPGDALVAENNRTDQHPWKYRLLHSDIGNHAAYPALCRYIRPNDLARFGNCPAVK